MAGREDTKNNRDERLENRSDDPPSSSTHPTTSSPSNTPHETSTPVISCSPAPPQESPSAVIAPPATIRQKAVASITSIWGFVRLLWKNILIRVIFTAAYSYLFYIFFPMKQGAIATMIMFLMFNWVLHSLYKNIGSIFIVTIAILWLLWLVYAILVQLIIVEVVRSIYLTSTKARLWLLVRQTLKVMFVDFGTFIGSILRVPFDYIRFRLRAPSSQVV